MTRRSGSAALVKVPFNGGHVLVHEESDRIIIKTVCDVLTVDAEGQRQRILRDPRLKSWTFKLKVRLPSDDRTREYLTIPRKKLAAFLYGIEANMVRDEKIRLGQALTQLHGLTFLKRVA